MLLSVVLELRSESKVLMPPHLGRANYAQLLAWIEGRSHDLAAQLHDAQGTKPLTCSSLNGVRPSGEGLHIQRGATYSVRITCFHEELGAWLLQQLETDPPLRWELQKHPFQIMDIYCDPEQNAWTQYTTYEQLAHDHLLQSRPPAPTISMEFASPVVFKSGGMHVPIPLPGLLFGGLLDRWNAYSPLPAPSDMRAFAESVVAISSYRLQSVPVRQKGGGLLIGGVGRVTYRALSDDRYRLAFLNLLADFSLFSGAGAKTTTGMGQMRCVERRK